MAAKLARTMKDETIKSVEAIFDVASAITHPQARERYLDVYRAITGRNLD